MHNVPRVQQLDVRGENPSPLQRFAQCVTRAVHVKRPKLTWAPPPARPPTRVRVNYRCCIKEPPWRWRDEKNIPRRCGGIFFSSCTDYAASGRTRYSSQAPRQCPVSVGSPYMIVNARHTHLYASLCWGIGAPPSARTYITCLALPIELIKRAAAS